MESHVISPLKADAVKENLYNPSEAPESPSEWQD
jgi:hypothetical protein